MWVDIPDGATLERIDVTDTGNPQPVYSCLPESDIGRLQEQVSRLTGELAATQLALTEQYEASLALQEEVANIQPALAETHEGLEV